MMPPTNSRDLLVNFGKCSGSSDEVFWKWSEDFGEVSANISGGFSECFGECSGSFGELSREVWRFLEKVWRALMSFREVFC